MEIYHKNLDWYRQISKVELYSGTDWEYVKPPQRPVLEQSDILGIRKQSRA